MWVLLGLQSWRGGLHHGHHTSVTPQAGGGTLASYAPSPVTSNWAWETVTLFWGEANIRWRRWEGFWLWLTSLQNCQIGASSLSWPQMKRSGGTICNAEHIGCIALYQFSAWVISNSASTDNAWQLRRSNPARMFQDWGKLNISLQTNDSVHMQLLSTVNLT